MPQLIPCRLSIWETQVQVLYGLSGLMLVLPPLSASLTLWAEFANCSAALLVHVGIGYMLVS